MPSEINLFGIYVSPILPVLVVGSLLAVLTVWLLNATRLSRFLRFHQGLFFIIVIIYSCLLNRYIRID